MRRNENLLSAIKRLTLLSRGVSLTQEEIDEVDAALDHFQLAFAPSRVEARVAAKRFETG